MKKRHILLIIYFIFLLIPIYWMLNTSFKPNLEITTQLTYYPHRFTFGHYGYVLTSWFWIRSFLNTLTYVFLNMAIVMPLAIFAAYAFSRWKFYASNHLFFWFLTNRMAPGAIFLVPMSALFATFKLFDTPLAVALAHCLFNLPLAVWILHGFMSGIPRQIDETAYVDGYGFFRFFGKIFFPLIKQGIGVTAFFVFLFSWVELLLARTITSIYVKPIGVTLTRSMTAEGFDWGVIAAVGVLTMIPGGILVYFIRNYLTKGFSMGRV